MSFSAPLAERMRPTKLDEYIGQDHLLKPGASLRRALDSGMIPSMIFWGPPGVGKTTLAQLIAGHLKRPFYTLSAISSIEPLSLKSDNWGLLLEPLTSTARLN